MGYAALGGLATVLVSVPPVREAWQVGGFNMILCLFFIILLVFSIRYILKKFSKSNKKNIIIASVIILGLIILRLISGPAIESIEAVSPATTGFLGGLGLPIIFSWIVGAFFAAGVAYVIGKVALGLRADYLAIATLLISEIIIAIVKHEDWLARGVKNVIGLKRPVPYEVNLQNTDWFIGLVEKLNAGTLNLIIDTSSKQDALRQLVIEGSTVFVKLCYAGLFMFVVIILLILTQKALYSPWGRMMRAIRDNEEAANAMGKNVVKRHLYIFVLGSAVVGIAGAMLVTYDGLFTPGSYQPMRFTFLIWVMVIVGGSGNNFGAILGGFAVWFVWIEAAPIALYLINIFTVGLEDTSQFKNHLINSVPYFRYLMMGTGLLLIMRYKPRGILPEEIKHS
jgi:branched-chain amino acid transport system permease protein